MPTRELAERVLAIATAGVQDHKREEAPDDIPPTIFYVPNGKERPDLIVPVPPPGTDPQTVLAISLAAAYDKFGPPSVIGHAADARMQIFGPDEGMPEDYQRGDIARNPNSQELLTVIVYYRDDDDSIQTLAHHMPYRYVDGELIFDEAIHTDSRVEGEGTAGALDDIIRQTFRKGNQLMDWDNNG